MEGAKLRRKPKWLIWLPRIWIALAAIFLLWQKLTYRGIFAFVAEWQFNALGFYHPALTYLVLMLVLCSPLLLLPVGRRIKRSQRSPLPPRGSLSHAIATTSRLLKALFIAALAAASAALVIALFTLLLPRSTGPVARQVISDEAPPPPVGPVELTGRLLYDKASAFNEDFILARRSRRFAPMVAADSDQTILRYFVELPPEMPTERPNTVSVRRGILRKGGLPGELIRLYRYAGFRVDQNYYVLFATPESMRRADLTEAAELLVLSGFLGLMGGIFTYRRRRLQKVAARHEAPLSNG